MFQAWETGPELARIFVPRVAKSKSARGVENLLQSLQSALEASTLLLERLLTNLLSRVLDGCGIDINLKQSTCFPGESSVEVVTGEKIAMKDVKIGDLVKTFAADGKIVFSPVVTFLDQVPDYGGIFFLSFFFSFVRFCPVRLGQFLSGI